MMERELLKNVGSVQTNSGFGLWKKDLEVILKVRFGLAICDCLDESQLIRFSSSGDSPLQVAGYLKDKWGLFDFRS